MKTRQLALYYQRITEIVREHGWAVQAVGDACPPWCYTVGRAARGHPELVITSLSHSLGAVVLNGLALAAEDGVDLLDRNAVARLFDHGMPPPRLRPVHPTWATTSLLNGCRVLLGRVPDALQVVMADPRGRFPWDAGHDLGFSQPRLWEPYPGGWPDPAPARHD